MPRLSDWRESAPVVPRMKSSSSSPRILAAPRKGLVRFAEAACILVLLGLGGCASTQKEDSEKERVSTLPWNTPAKWERSAPLGSAGVNY